MDESSVLFPDSDSPVGRAALRAIALPPRNAEGEHYNLDPAFGHGFGERLVSRLPPIDAAALTSYFEERYPKRSEESPH
jgi:hypothetical protein